MILIETKEIEVESVVFYDTPTRQIADMTEWAKEYCPSYHSNRVIDLSDISYYYDYSIEFFFTKKEDAVQFKLAWR